MSKMTADLVSNIPDYSYFLSLEEFDSSSRALAQSHPDSVKLFSLGVSREGRDLLCLKIGNGSRNALLMGCPHPNEPIGSMMLEYLSGELASNASLRDAMPYTFYIIKVWDVDGYCRNNGWLKGPFTVTNYTRHMFRPAGYEQVDWTFPIDYKQLHFHECLPETVAVKDLIDSVKPDFIYSLHNSGFGGVYWYLTDDLPEVYEDLHKIPAKNDLPLSLGEAESSSSARFADAIFQCMGVTATYDYHEKYSKGNYICNLRCGDTSAAYARRNYGSFTLLAELPYFYDPRVEDRSFLDISRAECAIKRNKDLRELTNEILDIFHRSRPYFTDNPYARTVENFNKETPVYDEERFSEPEYVRNVTTAEYLDLIYVSKFYKLTSYGMLVQAHEYELERLDRNDPENAGALKILTEGLTESQKAFDRLAAYLEENLNYSVVPIKNMVAVQLESGLTVMNALLGRKREEQKNV